MPIHPRCRHRRPLCVLPVLLLVLVTAALGEEAPVVHLAAPAQQALSAIVSSGGPEIVVDLGQQGHGSQAGAWTPSRTVGQPSEIGSLGTGNGYLVVSPDVVHTNTSLASAVLMSGFTPGETVDFLVDGSVAFTGAASTFGHLTIQLATGAVQGFAYLEAIGRTSGERAGSILEINDAATLVPGLSAAPHSVNTSASGSIAMFGGGYDPNVPVMIKRNGATIDIATPGASGFVSVRVNPGPNGNKASVYAFVQGSKFAGVSVEERSDAGTPPDGDLNAARAFVARAIFSSATAGTLRVGLEGFQPGETVNRTDCGDASSTADANGADTVILSFVAFPQVYVCTFTGATSGRNAWAAVEANPLAVDVPSALASPGTLSISNSTFTFAYDRLPVNAAGSIFVDSVLVSAGTTNSSGTGSVVLSRPDTVGPHRVVYVASTGQVAAASVYVTSAPPTRTPTITQTRTPSLTPTRTLTSTRTATHTVTLTPSITATVTSTATSTATSPPTLTRTATSTPTITPTATASRTPLPQPSSDGPRLVGSLVAGQTQVAFDSALPQGTSVRLYSFTAQAFLAQASSDGSGGGTFTTAQPLLAQEELAALNEVNGKVGAHRFVEPLGTATPLPVTMGSGPSPAPGLGLLLGLALLLGLGVTRLASRSPSGRR